MMLTGYVIRDVFSADASAAFWSPFPRLVTTVQHRFRSVGTRAWDYWSVSEERQHRAQNRIWVTAPNREPERHSVSSLPE